MLLERKMIVDHGLETQELTHWRSITVNKCISSSLELFLLPRTQQLYK